MNRAALWGNDFFSKEPDVSPPRVRMIPFGYIARRPKERGSSQSVVVSFWRRFILHASSPCLSSTSHTTRRPCYLDFPLFAGHSFSTAQLDCNRHETKMNTVENGARAKEEKRPSTAKQKFTSERKMLRIFRGKGGRRRRKITVDDDDDGEPRWRAARPSFHFLGDALIRSWLRWQ